MIEGEGHVEDFFYGLQPCWLTWDRLYRVYVDDGLIAGAYIAGQLYDVQSAAIQLQQLGMFLRPMIRRRLERRAQREAYYDSVDPFEPTLLDQDRWNFQIFRSDVVRTRIRTNRSLWTPFNVGTIEFNLIDGSTRRFILVGDQDPNAVRELIQRFDRNIEIIGPA